MKGDKKMVDWKKFQECWNTQTTNFFKDFFECSATCKSLGESQVNNVLETYKHLIGSEAYRIMSFLEAEEKYKKIHEDSKKILGKETKTFSPLPSEDFNDNIPF